MANGNGVVAQVNYLDNVRTATIMATLVVVVPAVGRCSGTSRDVRHDWTR
ncbi:MAG TPA: hypothetical protein VER55_07375 [Ardenticatenaceae bacterium]|nr:hypothetical protein [Ardenticatenaceae bacterium]